DPEREKGPQDRIVLVSLERLAAPAPPEARSAELPAEGRLEPAAQDHLLVGLPPVRSPPRIEDEPPPAAELLSLFPGEPPRRAEQFLGRLAQRAQGTRIERRRVDREPHPQVIQEDAKDL